MNFLDPVYLVAAAVTAPWWARKERHGWRERFGNIGAVPDRGQKRVLIHAVSVGEVNALRHLVPLLTPEVHVIISVGTDTGIKRARELFAAMCDVVRYPVDASWVVKKFLDRTRPDVVALVELELWPNFIGECKRRGVPVCVINGRLSERSFKGYRKLRRLLRGTFASLEFAAVQDADYAARFEAMGVSPGRCLITGTMKWDSAKITDSIPGAAELGAELGIRRGPGAPPLIVAGSTGPGEEALLHETVARIESRRGPVQLLCAPRKPERFDEAAAAMGSGGGACVRRSAKKAGESNRYLLDTIGELGKAYVLADVVVVGRSFGDLYGSDPIEPIALGRPTVIGPAVKDFQQTVKAFADAGGIVCSTREKLEADLEALLSDAAARARLAEKGRETIVRMQGASARHAELVMQLADARQKAPAFNVR